MQLFCVPLEALMSLAHRALISSATAVATAIACITTAMNKSHYEVLSVEAGASLFQIKRAYRERLLDTHPDKKNGQQARSQAQTQASIEQIQQAYRVLADPTTREQYDRELAESYKKQGFHNTGDGLDEYSLDEFTYDSDTAEFSLTCPRCQTARGFTTDEETLEEHAMERDHGGLQVLLQCSSCSLWLKVNFDIVEEYESS